MPITINPPLGTTPLIVTEGDNSLSLTVGVSADIFDLSSSVTLDVTTNSKDISLNDGAAGAAATVTLDTTNPTANLTIAAANDGTPEADRPATVNIALAPNILLPVIPALDIPLNITDPVALPQLSITPANGVVNITEGQTSDAFSIALSGIPTAPVTLTLTPSNDQIDLGAGAGQPTTLNFTLDNALTPQVVSLTAVADGIVEDAQSSTITVSTPAGFVNVSLAPVTVNITDPVVLPQLSITPADGVVNITEGQTSDTFSIALSGIPTAPVTLTLTPSNNQIDLGAGAGQPTTLNFTLDNALTPQTVSLTAVADGIVEGAQSSTITLSTDAANLVNVSLPPVTVNITDSNLLGLPGLVINPSPLDGIPLTEGEAPQTLELALNIAPPVPVAVTLTPDNDEVDLGVGAGVPLTLNFAGDATALVPQTVTISAVDDGIPEGRQTTTITTSINTTDLGFAGLEIPSFTVDITDSVVGNPGTGNPGTGNPSVPSLIQGLNDIFTVQGSPGQEVVLQFDLGTSNTSFLNEIGVFVVDDAQGTIDGIAPGQPNYLQAALNNAQPIFSVLPDANSLLGDVSLSRQLSFEAGTQLGFYLVQGSTAATAQTDLATGQTPPNVFLGSPSSNANGVDYLQTSALSNGGFTLAWRDQQGGSDQSFNNVVLTAQATTNSTLPVGTQLQQKAQLELIDLRAQSGQVVNFNFSVDSEARYNNTIGLYVVEDEQGTITDQLTGARLTPGQAGYAEAAIRQTAFISELQSNREATGQSQLNGGAIYAPYIIANGTESEFLSSNPLNQGNGEQAPVAYFAYQGINQDAVDHVRVLGNNTFGFEDLFGGGDNDFNDIVFQAKFT